MTNPLILEDSIVGRSKRSLKETYLIIMCVCECNQPRPSDPFSEVFGEPKQSRGGGWSCVQRAGPHADVSGERGIDVSIVEICLHPR